MTLKGYCRSNGGAVAVDNRLELMEDRDFDRGRLR